MFNLAAGNHQHTELQAKHIPLTGMFPSVKLLGNV